MSEAEVQAQMEEEPEEPAILFVEGHFQRVAIGPDDLLVLSYPGHVSDRVLQSLRRCVKAVFPDHKAVILEEGMKLGAMGPEEATV